MTVRVRFAPSPTGYLHPGNIRTALVNYLFAKKHGGEFLLRMDDTDKERSLKEYEDAILNDMQWLHMPWDGPVYRESERFEKYEAAKEKLIASGRLYACYETAEELDFKRKMLSGRGLPPIYDRAALKLSDEDKAKLEAEGKKPHWRFLLNDGNIEWDDMIRGPVAINARTVSDPVLVRADGVPLYTFCSVVDDIEFNITHILRGEDHVTNTAVQTQIFEALGGTIPAFGHMALIKTKDGELSKRVGGSDIRSLREVDGFEAMSVNALLARLGTSDPIEPIADMATLIASFDISKFGRAQANYDKQELERLNAKIVQQLPFADVAERLAGSGVDEDFWLSVRGNLNSVSEAKDWWDILHKPIEAANDDVDYTATAAELYPTAWEDGSFQTWTNAVKEKTGRKGKELFMPLRRALTGREDGPELKAVLALMPPEKAIARLKGEAA